MKKFTFHSANEKLYFTLCCDYLLAETDLIDRREWGAHRARVEAGPLVKHPARRPLPAAVQDPAGGLLPVQGARGGLVPAELSAALAVAVRGAGLTVQAPLLRPGARGQALRDVLVVGGGASLVGAAVEARTEK